MGLENDFLSHQIRGIGTGLGSIITFGKGKTPGSQIILPKKQSETLVFKERIRQLVETGAYEKAIKYINDLKSIIPKLDYLNLKLWFNTSLSKYPDNQLLAMGLSKQRINRETSIIQNQLNSLNH